MQSIVLMRLRFEDQTLTFDQINSRANQLAHYLLACGMGRKRTIGVMLERGPESLVALLAVFKAGGCYLPLDPVYPPSVSPSCLRTHELSLLITKASLRARLPEMLRESSVLMPGRLRNSAQRTRLLKCCRNNLPTSSTLPARRAGPKGVTIEHRQLSHTLQRLRRWSN